MIAVVLIVLAGGLIWANFIRMFFAYQEGVKAGFKEASRAAAQLATDYSNRTTDPGARETADKISLAIRSLSRV